MTSNRVGIFGEHTYIFQTCFFVFATILVIGVFLLESQGSYFWNKYTKTFKGFWWLLTPILFFYIVATWLWILPEFSRSLSPAWSGIVYCWSAFTSAAIIFNHTVASFSDA